MGTVVFLFYLFNFLLPTKYQNGWYEHMWSVRSVWMNELWNAQSLLPLFCWAYLDTKEPLSSMWCIFSNFEIACILLLLSCCSVTQSCLTLQPIDCSMPGLPVPHHLPKFTQVHVHCISDAVQPSHSLMPSSPPTLNLLQLQGFFQWVSCSHQVTSILVTWPLLLSIFL